MPKSTVHLSSFALFEATATPEETVKFCQDLGLLQRFSDCIRCGSDNIKLQETERAKVADGIMWRCRVCRTSWSHRRGSLFQGKHTSLRQILQILRLWCQGLLHTQISSDAEIVEQTVHEYIKIFQNVLMDFYERLPLHGAVGLGGGELLGADGGIVAADEMRIGRRKKGYFGHKTRPLADVVGAVEQKPGGRLILEIMPKLHNGKMRQKGPPTAAEIRPFAAAFVHPGAPVYTDGARAYEVLAREFSWDHRSVSHKRGEWVREEGPKKVHTHKIDGMWAHVRGFINARGGIRKHRLEWYLREFEWRHNTEGCLFASMCSLIEKRGFMASPNLYLTLNHGSHRRTPTSDSKTAPKRALSAAPAPKAKRRL